MSRVTQVENEENDSGNYFLLYSYLTLTKKKDKKALDKKKLIEVNQKWKNHKSIQKCKY